MATKKGSEEIVIFFARFKQMVKGSTRISQHDCLIQTACKKKNGEICHKIEQCPDKNCKTAIVANTSSSDHLLKLNQSELDEKKIKHVIDTGEKIYRNSSNKLDPNTTVKVIIPHQPIKTTLHYTKDQEDLFKARYILLKKKSDSPEYSNIQDIIRKDFDEKLFKEK
jgi:hypothetical protein